MLQNDTMRYVHRERGAGVGKYDVESVCVMCACSKGCAGR